MSNCKVGGDAAILSLHNSASAAQPSSVHYRPDIDGLRSYAVLAVVFYHAFPDLLRGGYVGVDVFFVISGYLISSILIKEAAEGSLSLGKFYARRARRLFPALTLCMATVLVAGLLWLLPSELTLVGKHVLFGAGFLSNIATWSEIGYFDAESTAKPLLHLWSLGVEEQFYIVWPIVIWLASTSKARFAAALVFIGTVSFALNVSLAREHVSSAFLLPLPRFWEFLIGAAIASAPGLSVSSKVRAWLAVCGLTALTLSVLTFTPSIRYPGWAAALPVFGTACLIFAGPTTFVNRKFFSNPALVFVGLVSYPFYLWHWPLLSYAYIIRLGKPPTPLMATALVIVSFGLACLTYLYVEKPIRLGRWRHWSTSVTSASILLIGVLGGVIWVQDGWPSRFHERAGFSLRKVAEASLDPIFKPTDDMSVNFDGRVLIGRIGSGAKKVALSGDSLMFQYAPRAQKLFEEGALRTSAYFVVAEGCPPIPGIAQPEARAYCSRLPGVLLDVVERESIGSVVLAASWSGYGGDGTTITRAGVTVLLEGGAARRMFFSNLEDYVRELQVRGANVSLVLGAPTHGQRFDPGKMIKRGLLGVTVHADVMDDVPVTELRAEHANADAELRSIAARTGAFLFDPVPAVCGHGKETCSPFSFDGAPKYSDGVHLRPIFVREHVQFLDSLLIAGE